MEREPDFMMDVLRIGLGITLGGVFLFILFTLYMRIQVQQFAEEASQYIEESTAEMQAQTKAQAAERERRQRMQVQQRREAAARAKARDEAEIRKEAAWRASWQPTTECTEVASIECGNEYIRARRQFEAKYRP